jgi:hypothetical protein
MRRTFKGNSPSEREPFRVSLHAGGALREIAGDGLRRREPQPAHVGHGSRAAIEGDIVAQRGIAAGKGQVPIADRYRAASPAARSGPV